jgi:hypothetical protein
MATVLDLSDPRLSLPDFILVDASVLLETRTPSGAPPSRRQAAVNQFLRLVQQAIIDGNTIALACTLTLEECYFKILQANLMDPTSAPNERSAVARRLNLAPNRVSWHQLYKDFPLLIQNYLPDLEAFFRWVQGIPITILCIGSAENGELPLPN